MTMISVRSEPWERDGKLCCIDECMVPVEWTFVVHDGITGFSACDDHHGDVAVMCREAFGIT